MDFLCEEASPAPPPAYKHSVSISAPGPVPAPTALLPNDKFLGLYPARFIRVCLTFKSRLASVIPIEIKQILG
ncbi:hypothetical protein V1477_004175 [Vespula maculifrons]|uniref:Uncharacterized protein n=1 Tax=Vespula maculifrons TaxID=7453 RepID=A0ABD2CTH0_VESMC